MSIPLVASATRCDEMRLSSHSNMRIQVARSGASTPSNASVARENTNSLNNGAA